MNIGLTIVIGIIGIFTAILILFLTLSLPVTICWKIYRKIRYGYKLTD